MGNQMVSSTLNYRSILFSICIAILICVSAYLYKANNNQINALMKSYKLIPVPDSYTELYFTGHGLLPRAYKAKQKMYFEFTVHNLENKQMKYSPRVVAIDGSKVIPISQQTITLDHNQSVDIPITFALEDEIEHVKIEVQIPEKRQSIHFWLDYFRVRPVPTK